MWMGWDEFVTFFCTKLPVIVILLLIFELALLPMQPHTTKDAKNLNLAT